jgi:hypothetical protein
VDGKRVVLSGAVAFGVTLLVLAVAAFMGIFVLVALNGFSEREGMPILVGYFVLVGLANAALVALSSWLVMRDAKSSKLPVVLATTVLFGPIPTCLGTGLVLLVTV